MVENLADFLLRADEKSEMLADSGMNMIRSAREAEGLPGPVPDPVTLTHRNLRLLIRAAYKAGAAFGFEEVANALRKIDE